MKQLPSETQEINAHNVELRSRSMERLAGTMLPSAFQGTYMASLRSVASPLGGWDVLCAGSHDVDVVASMNADVVRRVGMEWVGAGTGNYGALAAMRRSNRS